MTVSQHPGDGKAADQRCTDDESSCVGILDEV
jgi:hypothetical protein